MFERFTGDARAAVVDAVSLAESSGDGWVGREHLLVGLAGAGEPTLVAEGLSREVLVAGLRAHSPSARDEADAQVLAAIGIDLDAIRAAVEENLGEGSWAVGNPRERPDPGLLGRLLPRHRPFTSGARKALELGLREAIAEHSRELTTTHLLLGLLRDPGPAATALVEARLPLENLRARAAGRPPAA